jgi:hypothetical protein
VQCIQVNLYLFSRFAALSGVFAVRKAEWLPDPDSNMRPIRSDAEWLWVRDLQWRAQP